MLSSINIKVPQNDIGTFFIEKIILLSVKNYTVSFPGAIYLHTSVCIVIILVDRLFRIKTTGNHHWFINIIV